MKKKKKCSSLPLFSLSPFSLFPPLSSAREREREPARSTHLARGAAAEQLFSLCIYKAKHYGHSSTTGAGEAPQQRGRRCSHSRLFFSSPETIDLFFGCHSGGPRRGARASHRQADAGAPRPCPFRDALLARGDAGGQRFDVWAQEVRENDLERRI